MKYAVLILTMILVGCSSTPVDTNYYLLRHEGSAVSRELIASPDFALGKVAIAPYIDQPGLVLEVSAGQIRPAQHHQWAEPMHQSVRTFLQRGISSDLGEDLFPKALSSAPTVLDIRVDQLHGTDNGEAVLLAYWWTTRDGEIQSTYQYAQSQRLARDGYAALAEAEETLLRGLAANIADALGASR
jgi:uncharacterized lipoprotein YmbA